MSEAVRKSSPWVRAGVDYLAPAMFLVAYFVAKRVETQDRAFLIATGVLVAASAVALAIGWIVERRIAPLPLMAGLFAVVFGGLTLIFNDSVFLKIKPTIINLCFSAALLGGLAFRRLFLKSLLNDALSMDDAAWRILTVRYGVFFFGLAVLNEIVWRTQPEATWVLFRMPGLLALSILFSLTQIPFMSKHGRFGGGLPETPES